MSREDLTTYMNDHLAGSVGAVEHLDYLIETCDDAQLKAFFSSARIEIEADQEVLKKLIATIGDGESAVRKAGAWLGEKLSRFKVGPGDANEFGLFLSLETLVLGITGKQQLWTALAAASKKVPELRGPDYAALEARAVAQAKQMDEKRRELARKVFARAQPNT